MLIEERCIFGQAEQLAEQGRKVFKISQGRFMRSRRRFDESVITIV